MDDDSNRLIATLLEESDRGLILAGVAFLDDALSEMLATRFRGDLSKRDKGSLFTHFGPLSSMSSRSLVAYALELIDEQMRGSLDEVRKIRNQFAHFAGITTLPKKEIENLLSMGEPSLKLGVVAFGDSADPKFSDERVKVTLCIVSLWAKIRHKTAELKK